MRSLRIRTRQTRRVFQLRPSSGLTVIELMIASAVALLMVAGLITAFRVISDQVAMARATLELAGQLRSGTHRIREDLQNVSAPVRPWLRPSNGLGYFEYIEGPLHDASFANGPASIYGDIDDILMFTARTEGEPFIGRFGGATITSREAEIIIWTELINEDGSTHPTLLDPTTNQPLDTWSPGEQIILHRRVLLVRPDVTPPAVDPNVSRLRWLQDFYANNDVSVRISGNQLAANSLADLTRRENRFGHHLAAASAQSRFPHSLPTIQPYEYLDTNNALQYSPFNRSILTHLVQSGVNQGNDVLLSNILAFDVQAYDPQVGVRAENNRAMLPHDIRYIAGTGVGRGGYVDLFYGGLVDGTGYDTFYDGQSGVSHYDLYYDQTLKNPRLNQAMPFADPSLFSGLPLAVDPARRLPMATYCTWSLHYETDGLDQDGDGEGSSPTVLGLKQADGVDNNTNNQIDENIDEGTDGFDNDMANGVDDTRERETVPPYLAPLRGIKVTIRLYEPDSQRVRQMSAIQDFVPE